MEVLTDHRPASGLEDPTLHMRPAKPGEACEVLGAVLKIGLGASEVDNIMADGLVTMIDLETGLTGDAFQKISKKGN